MGDLAVRVMFHGEVVEHKVLPVKSAVTLGDWPGARVAFPGTAFQVWREGRQLRIRGRTIDEGEHVEISLGSVHLRLENVEPITRIPSRDGRVDVPFLGLAIVVVVLGSWIDAVEMWIDRLPARQMGGSLVQEVLQAVQGQSGGVRPAAAASHQWSRPPAHTAPEVAEGPRHFPDDRETGTDFYGWYRRFLPADSLAFDASETLLLDPNDARARRFLARGAYNAGYFETAAWHYQWLVDRFPRDGNARIRLAWAERRRGHHTREIGLYQELLAATPGHHMALGGYATALARLGRFDEALAVLDEVDLRAPRSPYTAMSRATVSALHGDDEGAMAALKVAIRDRAQLDNELQLEMRRDLALDPAFGSLRRDWRLRALLRRHLGAAAPGRVR